MDGLLRQLPQGIRIASATDIPWIIDLCLGIYPPGYFDPQAAWEWLARMIVSRKFLVLCGRKSWLCVTITSPDYQPTIKEGAFLPVAGHAGKELFIMTKIAVQWCFDQGAHKVYFGAVTGRDLGPLARYVGAVPVSPTYEVTRDVFQANR